MAHNDLGHAMSLSRNGYAVSTREKHIRGFMAASKDIAQLYEGADPDKPDRASRGCCQEERLCELGRV